MPDPKQAPDPKWTLSRIRIRQNHFESTKYCMQKFTSKILYAETSKEKIWVIGVFPWSRRIFKQPFSPASQARQQTDTVVFKFNITFYKLEECRKLQCCGSGSAWIRNKLISRIRIRIKVISWIRIRINLQIEAELYGVPVWTYLSTFSRFWAFLRKPGSGSASKWKVGSGSESASASISLKKTFNWTILQKGQNTYNKTFCCTLLKKGWQEEKNCLIRLIRFNNNLTNTLK